MIVLDIETTGLDPDRSSIVSLGAVSLVDTNKTFYMECRVWNGAEIHQEALNVNGFTRDEIMDEEKCSDAQLIAKFSEWLAQQNDYVFGGLNHHFDLLFIMAAARRGGITVGLESGSVVPKRIVDLHSVCYAHMVARGVAPPVSENGFSKLRGEDIYKYVGIPAEPHPHNSLNGAVWEAESLSRLLYQRSSFEKFFDHSIPWLEESGAKR
ncbi:MAG: exonuclease domain-containing protein [Candidatus Paceibacterota bacterium]